MSRRPNSIKVEEWTQRFARFRNSSQTVVEFCRGEGVSQPSFYQWKKKLSSIEPAMVGKAKSLAHAFEPASFTPVQIAPTSTRHPSLTIRLQSGIELELGDDSSVIEAVVKQVLEAGWQATGASSC